MAAKLPWHVRAFFSVMFLCVIWLLLEATERHYNPQGFDLGMQYQIQENAELSKQSFEVWKEESEK